MTAHDDLPPSSLSPSQHRAALALAEAILPDAYGIPGADEDTVAAAEQYIAWLGKGSPLVVKLWGAALKALDSAARLQTGKRFSDLTAERQERLLREWEEHPILRVPLQLVGVIFKMPHFDLDRVVEKLGHERKKAVAEPHRYLQQAHDAATWDGDEELECDVVVVGTGAGGAVVGSELAARGHAVLFIEEGRYHHRDEFTGSSMEGYKKFYPGQIMTVGNAVVPIFTGRMVGGSTAVNTASCFRTPEFVLDHWCELLGTDELSPSNMEGYFLRLEEELNIAPHPKSVIGPFGDVVARGCDKLGWSHAPIRRNTDGCEGQGFCQFGCAADARRSTNLTFIPWALQKGAMLFTGLKAENVIVENGRAVGIEARAGDNDRRLRVRAQTVVFCGGAIPTPLFLLKQGLCNSSGQVGRNLSIHPSAGMAGQFDDLIDGEHHAPQGYCCDEFLEEGILMMGGLLPRNFGPMVFNLHGQRLAEAVSQMDYVGGFGVIIHDEQIGRVWRDIKGQPVVTYNYGPETIRLMNKGLKTSARLFWEAGAKRLYPSVFGWSLIASQSDFDAFQRAEFAASEMSSISYHPLATCRMGSDPKTSVVGLDHETHDLPGLFIVDGSTVPTPPSVNPQITIMAMAMRAAEKIAARLD